MSSRTLSRRLPALVLAVASVAQAAGAANIVVNGDFATGVEGWVTEDAASVQLTWSPNDAQGAPASGSARVANTAAGAGQGLGISQCAGAVGPGHAYTFGGKVRFPTGQDRTGSIQLGLRFYPGANCTGSPIEQPREDLGVPSNAFVALADDGTVPAGAASVELLAFPSKIEAGGELVAFFDDLFFDSDFEPPPGDPAPPPGPWLSSAELPGFRAKVRITAGGNAIAGTAVDDCIGETLCVAGALPDRAEVFVRVVGPKPNGFLWPTLVKFSTSKVEVWIEQLASQEVRYYELAAVAPGAELLTLDGLAHKLGFQP